MARYADDAKEQVRDAVDMVDLVGTKVDLRRAGANRFEGLCPFHDERTPSFGIDPVKKVYHCFGCQASGDPFTWAQEMEGLGFVESMEWLAERYGVTLERESEDPQEAERRKQRERLMELLERTAAFYVRYLWESTEAARAREYLLERGLDEPALREFRVGYSPSAWDKVLMASRKAGFSNRELYEAGLASRAKGEGRIYDRFRGRIMFPLADMRGRVLGFGARALRDNQQPKYLNTSENDIFHKGRQLFASDLARAHAARAGEVIVAEGYTDVIALHQAGLKNTVATMGTAMTPEQVGELTRLAPRALLALDADGAGQEAMVRAAKVARGKKLELRVVELPPGRDPADLTAEAGAAEMRRLVESSVPFVKFRVERALATGDIATGEGKDAVIGELRPVFADIPASVLREELITEVADRLDIAETLAGELLGRAGTPVAASAPAQSAATDEAPISRRDAIRLNGAEEQERGFLALCIALPAAGAKALTSLDLAADLTSERSRAAATWLRDHLDDPEAGLDAQDEALQVLIRDIRFRAPKEGDLPAEAVEAERAHLLLARAEREVVAARKARSGVDAALRAHRARQEEYSAAMDRLLEVNAPR
ncbi:MAG: DNA primase [Solirubrobacteraceae bacterium]|nr:DNA primase [Solirubrobacteraceae bacterium]